MTASEAMTGIASLVGAGGLTTIVVGFLAFKTEAAKGRRGEPTPAVAAATRAPILSAAEAEVLTNAMTLLTGALNRATALLEHTLQQHELDDEVERLLAAREMKLLLDQVLKARSGNAGPG